MKYKKLKKQVLIDLENLYILLIKSLNKQTLKINKLQSERDLIDVICQDHLLKINKIQAENAALNKAQDVMMDAGRKLSQEVFQLKSDIGELEKALIAVSASNEKLREENKYLQTEKEEFIKAITAMEAEIRNLEAANRLHLMKIERQQTALEKFEDLGRKLDEKGIDVWIARDADGDLTMFREMPTKDDDIYGAGNDEWIDMSNLNINIDLQPLQCKQYRLIEVQE